MTLASRWRRSIGGTVLGLTVILLVGCGASKKREAGIQELEKLEASVHGLGILASAGVTKQEYSQRLEDVLLNVRDLNQSEEGISVDFQSNEQPMVAATYNHLSQSMAAYEKARDYFGEDFASFECQDGCSFFPENQYDQIKQQFPTIEALAFGPEYTWYSDSAGNLVNRSYRRSDMLQALWKVAGDQDATAKKLIDQIAQN